MIDWFHPLFKPMTINYLISISYVDILISILKMKVFSLGTPIFLCGKRIRKSTRKNKSKRTPLEELKAFKKSSPRVGSNAGQASGMYKNVRDPAAVVFKRPEYFPYRSDIEIPH